MPGRGEPMVPRPAGIYQEVRTMTDSRLLLPPFDAETAAHKVRLTEDAWNSRDPQKVSLAYTPDSRWRNRTEFISELGL